MVGFVVGLQGGMAYFHHDPRKTDLADRPLQVELFRVDIRDSLCFAFRSECGFGNLVIIPSSLRRRALAHLHCLSGCDLACLLHCAFRPANPSPCGKHLCGTLLGYLVTMNS